MQYWLFVSFKIKISVFTCIEFHEWLSDLFFYIAFHSCDKFRPALRVYSTGGYDYMNAIVFEVNIRMLVSVCCCCFFLKNPLVSREWNILIFHNRESMKERISFWLNHHCKNRLQICGISEWLQFIDHRYVKPDIAWSGKNKIQFIFCNVHLDVYLSSRCFFFYHYCILTTNSVWINQNTIAW